jgi:MoaA/NifB/PqqE/SkfB family radical SAM enzyme
LEVCVDNATTISVKTGTNLEDMLKHLAVYPAYLEEQKVIVMCVGHAEIAMIWYMFVNRYERIFNFLREVNPEAWIVVCSLLPVDQLHNYQILSYKGARNAQLKEFTTNREKCQFYDALEKLKLGFDIPSRYFERNRLSLEGSQKFLRSLGHKISAMKVEAGW